jgi:hypothetical protein
MHPATRTTLLRFVSALVLAFALVVAAGCSSGDAESGDTDAPAEEPAVEQEATSEDEQPQYSSYTIYINDDDSYEEGGITYSIALNLEATNPTGSVAGAYSGTATAKTDTTGDVGGQQLNASAIANSTTLEFTIEDPLGEGALAPLTDDELTYTGSGTIVMEAAGSGTIGGAAGGFSNTSGQPVTVSVTGSEVTFKVTISGHEYTFTGTISGE